MSKRDSLIECIFSTYVEGNETLKSDLDTENDRIFYEYYGKRRGRSGGIERCPVCSCTSSVLCWIQCSKRVVKIMRLRKFCGHFIGQRKG